MIPILFIAMLGGSFLGAAIDQNNKVNSLTIENRVHIQTIYKQSQRINTLERRIETLGRGY